MTLHEDDGTVVADLSLLWLVGSRHKLILMLNHKPVNQ